MVAKKTLATEMGIKMLLRIRGSVLVFRIEATSSADYPMNRWSHLSS